jgi:hypothetical protein
MKRISDDIKDLKEGLDEWDFRTILQSTLFGELKDSNCRLNMLY